MQSTVSEGVNIGGSRVATCYFAVEIATGALTIEFLHPGLWILSAIAYYMILSVYVHYCMPRDGLTIPLLETSDNFFTLVKKIGIWI